MRSVLLRSALLTAVGVLVLAPLSSEANAASNALVTVTGSAPAAVSGSAVLTFSYSVLLPTAVTSAGFTTHQDPLLPALTTGIQLDGVPVQPSQVSAVGASDVSVSAGPGMLRAGEHVLTVQASVPGGDAASTSSSIAFAYHDSGGFQTRSSAPVVVAINQPDLAVALTPGVGQAPGVLGRLGTGRVAAVAVDVSNVGVGDPQADLTLTFPTGLELAAAGVARSGSGVAVPCVAAPAHVGQLRCALGAVAPLAGSGPISLIVAVTTSARPPVGAIAVLGISVQPTAAGGGVDANPSNNSTQLAMTFTGAARLSYAVRTSATTTRPGAVQTVTMTVRNSGPEPTGRTFGFLTLNRQRLRMLAFSRSALPAAQVTPRLLAQQLSPGFAALAPGASSLSAGLDEAAAGPVAGNGLVWDVGPLASGQSASATLTVRAGQIGGTTLSFLALADVGDPACSRLTCAPSSAALRVAPAAAKAVVTTSPAPSSSNTAAGRAPSATSTPAVVVEPPAQRPVAAPALASTGPATFNGAGLGFGLVGYGLALLMATRRRTALARAAGRHRG